MDLGSFGANLAIQYEWNKENFNLFVAMACTLLGNSGPDAANPPRLRERVFKKTDFRKPCPNLEPKQTIPTKEAKLEHYTKG